MMRKLLVIIFAIQVSLVSFSTVANAQNFGDAVGSFLGTVVIETIKQDQRNQQKKSQNAAREQEKKIHAAQKAEFTKRVQTSLKSLGFYKKSIDGDWGPGTKAAVLAYRNSFNLFKGEFEENELRELESHAAEGWRNYEEIRRSRDGGFFNREEMLIARDAGFSQRSIWLNAREAGFDNAAEFSAYQKSNFSTPSDFLSAQRGGFSNPDDFSTAKKLGFSSATEFQDFRASGYKNKADYDAAKVMRQLSADAQAECEEASFNRNWVKADSSCGLAEQFNPNNSTVILLAKTAKTALKNEESNLKSELKTAKDVLSEILENPNDIEEKAFKESLSKAREDVSLIDAKLVNIEISQDYTSCSVAFNSNNWKAASSLCSGFSTRDFDRRSKNENWSKIAANMNNMVAVSNEKLKEEEDRIAINRNKLALSSAKERGQNLIDSVEAYSLRGKSFDGGIDVVRALVSTKSVMNVNDASIIEKAINRLSELVEADEKFVADRQALVQAKKQTEVASATAARKKLEQIDLYLNDYVAGNLSAANIAQMLGLLDEVEGVLKLGNAKEMVSALANANIILQRENLKSDFLEFASSLDAVVVSKSELEAQKAQAQALAQEQKVKAQALAKEQEAEAKEQKAQALARDIEAREAKNVASLLIKDIENYSSEGGKFSEPITIAGALVKLRSALNGEDIQILIKSTDEVNVILKSENEFNDAMELRILNSAESSQNAKTIATETGRSYLAFMTGHISNNIISPNIGEMLNLQKQLEESLNDDNWQKIILSTNNIEDYLNRNDLSEEFVKFVEIAQSGKKDGVELSQANNGIVLNEANKELLEGSPNDIIILQNASGSSPNVGKNLFGKLVFDNDTANVCWLHDKPTASLASLLLDRKIGELGVSTVISKPNCNSDLFDNTDLILVQRGKFLELPVALAHPAILAFEDGNLKQLEKVTNDDVLSFQASLSQSIENLRSEIMAEEREGFGLVSLPNGSGNICMSTDTDLLAHANLLAEQKEILGLYFSDDASLSPITLERAFVMAQRQICSGIYADAEGIKLLLNGLERENISHMLVPIWFKSSQYEASVASIDETKKQRKARLLAQRQKAESEAELRSQQEKTEEKLRLARQEKMREKNRDVAMGNLKVITDSINAFYEGKQSNFSSLFPQSAGHKNGQANDKWKLTTKSVELVDFGTGTWRSRSVSAILAEIKYSSENAVLGQYRNDCIVVGYLIDDEFDLLRDSVEAPCSVGSIVRDWKISHKFESSWFAK